MALPAGRLGGSAICGTNGNRSRSYRLKHPNTIFHSFSPPLRCLRRPQAPPSSAHPPEHQARSTVIERPPSTGPWLCLLGRSPVRTVPATLLTPKLPQGRSRPLLCLPPRWNPRRLLAAPSNTHTWQSNGSHMLPLLPLAVHLLGSTPPSRPCTGAPGDLSPTGF